MTDPDNFQISHYGIVPCGPREEDKSSSWRTFGLVEREANPANWMRHLALRTGRLSREPKSIIEEEETIRVRCLEKGKFCGCKPYDLFNWVRTWGLVGAGSKYFLNKNKNKDLASKHITLIWKDEYYRFMKQMKFGNLLLILVL